MVHSMHSVHPREWRGMLCTIWKLPCLFPSKLPKRKHSVITSIHNKKMRLASLVLKQLHIFCRAYVIETKFWCLTLSVLLQLILKSYNFNAFEMQWKKYYWEHHNYSDTMCFWCTKDFCDVPVCSLETFWKEKAHTRRCTASAVTGY